MNETRKLAAIMFTDIVGYSAMMSKDEKQVMNVLEKTKNFLLIINYLIRVTLP